MCKYTPFQGGVMDLMIHFQTTENGKARAYLDQVRKPGPPRVAVRMPHTTQGYVTKKKASHLYCSFPKDYNPRQSVGTSDKPILGDIAEDIWTGLLKLLRT